MLGLDGPVTGPELLVELDRSGDLPLHEQLERALRENIRRGRLPAGTRLPSTRGLATELGISRGVVTEAYGQLSAEGYLETRQGAAVRVARAARAAVPRAPARSLLPSFPYHFHPGLPDLAGFPRDRWLRSLRAALGQSPLDAVGYGDPRGVPRLRETLADYLGRVRGTAADPENMLVCTGFMQGFSILCRWLYGQGVEAIAMEDPGWHMHRLIAEQAGVRTIPVGVDERGLDVQALAASGARAVLVTPAHQFPTGVVLDGGRRRELRDWARDGGLIIEDDYDAEHRYDRPPVPALRSALPGQVCYTGSVSKLLAPALRTGWLLVPAGYHDAIVAAKREADLGNAVLPQLVLAELMASGELERHLRLLRKRHVRRRDSMISAIRAHLPQARVHGAAAGLHLTLTFDALPPRTGLDVDLAAAALRHGVKVQPLSWHSQRPHQPGLVLGYAARTPAEINEGIAVIGSVLRRQPG